MSQPTIRKRQRGLEGVYATVIPLSADGLTTVYISAHLAEVHSPQLSKSD